MRYPTRFMASSTASWDSRNSASPPGQLLAETSQAAQRSPSLRRLAGARCSNHPPGTQATKLDVEAAHLHVGDARFVHAPDTPRCGLPRSAPLTPRRVPARRRRAALAAYFWCVIAAITSSSRALRTGAGGVSVVI